MENSELQTTYQKAISRVQEERSFYTHIGLYLICNTIIFIIILQLRDYFYDGYLLLNLISTPIIWGVFLLVHGLWVFRGATHNKKRFNLFVFTKKWEERKIKEIMK